MGRRVRGVRREAVGDAADLHAVALVVCRGGRVVELVDLVHAVLRDALVEGGAQLVEHFAHGGAGARDGQRLRLRDLLVIGPEFQDDLGDAGDLRQRSHVLEVNVGIHDARAFVRPVGRDGAEGTDACLDRPAQRGERPGVRAVDAHHEAAGVILQREVGHRGILLRSVDPAVVGGERRPLAVHEARLRRQIDLALHQAVETVAEVGGNRGGVERAARQGEGGAGRERERKHALTAPRGD